MIMVPIIGFFLSSISLLEVHGKRFMNEMKKVVLKLNRTSNTRYVKLVSKLCFYYTGNLFP